MLLAKKKKKNQACKISYVSHMNFHFWSWNTCNWTLVLMWMVHSEQISTVIGKEKLWSWSCCLVIYHCKKKSLIWEDKYENSMKWAMFPNCKIRAERSPQITHWGACFPRGRSGSCVPGGSCQAALQPSESAAVCVSLVCRRSRWSTSTGQKHQMFTDTTPQSHVKYLGEGTLFATLSSHIGKYYLQITKIMWWSLWENLDTLLASNLWVIQCNVSID